MHISRAFSYDNRSDDWKEGPSSALERITDSSWAIQPENGTIESINVIGGYLDKIRYTYI